ncbi:MAG: hypothetical protein P8046_08025 [Anaerolineales bacterium]
MAVSVDHSGLGFYPNTNPDSLWGRPSFARLEDSWDGNFTSDSLFMCCGLDGNWLWHLDDQSGVYNRINYWGAVASGRGGFLPFDQCIGSVWPQFGIAPRKYQAAAKKISHIIVF